MNYNDNFQYPETDSLEIGGEMFFAVHPNHAPLRYRREEMGLTQQQVADAAQITLRQYQRFESGERSMSSASLRIGLSICAVLNLDPYRFIPPTSYTPVSF